MNTIIKIEDWMTTPVITIGLDNTVFEAAQLMDTKKIGSLVVVKENQKLCGIVTERDIITKVLNGGKDYKTTKVSEIMTTEVYTVNLDASLLDISRVMQKYHLRRVVVIDNDRVVGIVTARDLIELVSS